MKFLSLRILPAAIFVVLASSSAGAAEQKATRPDGNEVLRAMSAKLAAAKAFTFEAHRHSHGVVIPGEAAPEDVQISVAVKRPDGFVARAKGRSDTREIIFNGRTLTVFDATHRFYATAPLRTSIDGMLAALETDYGFRPPLAELASSDIRGDIRHRVQAVKYLGTERLPAGFLGLRGVECHRLQLAGKAVDAELWVGVADQLPRKLVVTLKQHGGQPRLTATIDQWNLAPQLAASEFQFQPSAGAKRVPLKTKAEFQRTAKKRTTSSNRS